MARITPVRFAIVGLGMGRSHAAAALKTPEVDLVAIAEPNQQRFDDWLAQMQKDANKAMKTTLKSIRRFDDYKESLRLEGYEVMFEQDFNFSEEVSDN